MISPAWRAERRAGAEERRELPDLGELGGQPAGRVERRVHRGGGRQQRRDGDHHEARLAERGSRGLGDRGLAVAGHLLDGERAEHADRDEDVGHARHARARGTSPAAARARGRAGRPRRT